MIIKRFTMCAALAALVPLGSCGGEAGNEASAPTENAQKAAGENTLATGLGDATKFAAAAKAAGLDATLAGPGPYTVLVPSDAAFDKMPAGALETLMKPEARSDLTAVLT